VKENILMNKYDIVLQGPVYRPWTLNVVRWTRALRFIGKIILSTWKGSEGVEEAFKDISNIKYVYSEPPTLAGHGNRNMQIVSSHAGMKYVESDYCIKLRSDIFLPHFETMESFGRSYMENNKVVVLSMYSRYPFHPRDHIFWGKTDLLKQIFDIPLDKETRPEYTVRSESYIGMYYYALFNSEIKKYIKNTEKYIIDTAPQLNEALTTYHAMIKDVLVPMPRMDVYFPKHYPNNDYPFHQTKQLYGEFFYEHLMTGTWK